MTRLLAVLTSTVTAMPGVRLMNLHGRPGELDAHGIDQAALFIMDGVVRHMRHLRINSAVLGVGKSLDLDGGNLPGIHETDVLVFEEGLDLQHLVLWHHHHQGLGGRHNTAHGMNRELLHDAINGSGQRHEAAA